MTVPPNRHLDQPLSGRVLILIPAYNEELSLGLLLDEVQRELPDYPVLVVNDGYADRTPSVARQCGVAVLNMPYNVGVGTAVQAGFQYAWRNGFDYVLRLDGDGQHPPDGARRLLEAMQDAPSDLILGTRFGANSGIISTWVRHLGVRGLALFLSIICQARITDPTSGLWLINRRLVFVFANLYPSDYPEPEALALLRRLGYTFREVPVCFRSRKAGLSSIGRWDTLFHALKVVLALCVDRVRPVDVRYSSSRVKC